jgi:hypothetical protein
VSGHDCGSVCRVAEREWGGGGGQVPGEVGQVRRVESAWVR